MSLEAVCDAAPRWPLLSFPPLQAVDTAVVQLSGTGPFVSLLLRYAGEGSSGAAPLLSDALVSRAQARSVLLEGAWKGWIDRPVDDARADAMSALLQDRKVESEDVERLMAWPLLRRDADGFWDTRLRPLAFPRAGYRAVLGFDFNSESGTVTLLFQHASGPQDTLFDDRDVREVFGSGVTSSFFSLDPPNHKESPYHPFQELKFLPAELEGTGLLATMLHADLLLKYLSTGVEVSASGPHFPLRAVAGERGLLSGLPDGLPHLLRPVRDRSGGQKHPNRAHRFWIEPEEMPYYRYEAEGNPNVECFRVSTAPMRVRKHLMSTNQRGELVDAASDSDTDEDAEDDDPNVSAEMKFANDVTFAFPTLRKHFPVLARLQELHRLIGVSALLMSLHRGIAESIRASLPNEAPIVEKLRDLEASLRSGGQFPLDENALVEDGLEKTLQANNVSRHQASGSSPTRAPVL